MHPPLKFEKQANLFQHGGTHDTRVTTELKFGTFPRRNTVSLHAVALGVLAMLVLIGTAEAYPTYSECNALCIASDVNQKACNCVKFSYVKRPGSSIEYPGECIEWKCVPVFDKKLYEDMLIVGDAFDTVSQRSLTPDDYKGAVDSYWGPIVAFTAEMLGLNMSSTSPSRSRKLLDEANGCRVSAKCNTDKKCEFAIECDIF